MEKKLEQLTMGRLLENWTAVECDFHETFGVDFGSGVLSDRSWRWFKIRLMDLLGKRSRLATRLGLLEGLAEQ